MVIGVASLVLAISLFLDWFTFNVPFVGLASRSGTWTSEYLYAALALSVEAVVYLLARGVWSELRFQGRFAHHVILIALTSASLAVTLIGFVTKPAYTLLGVPIPVSWTYGAYVAVPAAAVAMVASVGQLAMQVGRARSASVGVVPAVVPAAAADEQPRLQTPRYCPRCGAPRGLTDKFCATCGASFEEELFGHNHGGEKGGRAA